MAKEVQRQNRKFPDWAFPFRIISGFLFATIVALTIAQVFFRFILDSPLIWSEELVRLFLVWLTFLGAAVLCWDGTHLSVDTFFVKLPPKARHWVRNVNRLLAILFLIILVYYSIPLVMIDHMTTMSAFDVPASVVRVPATIGGALMILYIVLRWAYRFRRERSTKGDTIYDSTDPM
jgi:TRAP-type C4-dicarboxylate transport system permease small subunit